MFLFCTVFCPCVADDYQTTEAPAQHLHSFEWTITFHQYVSVWLQFQSWWHSCMTRPHSPMVANSFKCTVCLTFVVCQTSTLTPLWLWMLWGKGKDSLFSNMVKVRPSPRSLMFLKLQIFLRGLRFMGVHPTSLDIATMGKIDLLTRLKRGRVEMVEKETRKTTQDTGWPPGSRYNSVWLHHMLSEWE